MTLWLDLLISVAGNLFTDVLRRGYRTVVEAGLRRGITHDRLINMVGLALLTFFLITWPGTAGGAAMSPGGGIESAANQLAEFVKSIAAG